MLNIVLFGPPGAGKGTQAEKLSQKFKLVHLSTGDIFRSNIRFGTELGLLAKNFMDQGNLVPDEVTISMLEKEVEKQIEAKGFIFDGFPRTISQAEALDHVLAAKGTSISMTLALEVDEMELTRRILERGKSSGRADDQDEATVRNRVSEYNTKTAPLKIFYDRQKKLHSVEGVGSIDTIFQHLVKVVEKMSIENGV